MDALSAILAAPNLSDRAKVVRIVLDLHAGADGLYRGTKDWARLASLSGFSPKKVQRALLDLEVFGSVERVSRGRRPSDVRLLDRTPPVQASDDRPPDTVVRSDTSVRDTSVRSDTLVSDIGVRSDSSGPVQMGGLGGVRTNSELMQHHQHQGVDRPKQRDSRLAMAAAIDGQTERYDLVRRTAKPTPRIQGIPGTPEHEALDRRFAEALARLDAGTPERTRLASCRLSTPAEPVLRRACEDLGGVEQVADVLAWAWAEHAAGRLVVGHGDAGQALRDAFRGEGRWWRGIVAAHAKRRPNPSASQGWQPPTFDDIEPATDEELALPAGWAR